MISDARQRKPEAIQALTDLPYGRGGAAAPATGAVAADPKTPSSPFFSISGERRRTTTTQGERAA